jgi:hypothetical protein
MDILSFEEMKIGCFSDQPKDIVTLPQKIAAEVGSDETVSTCYQNTLHVYAILYECHASKVMVEKDTNEPRVVSILHKTNRLDED